MQQPQLSLTYNLKASNLEKDYPLIVILHGYGSDENDLFGFSGELPEEYMIVSAKAPYQLQPYGNAWYAINFDATQGKFNDLEQARSSRDIIINFIEELKQNFNFDHKRITLLGFSQGTILSFAVALSQPQLIKNVVGLSGYIDTEMLMSNYQSNDFSQLNVYNSHGSVDQVIPVEWARKNKAIFEDLKINYNYEEFPVGHGVNPQNFASFKKWLAENDNH